MKILLDECVTKHLKSYLTEYHVFTVREMQWGGIKNGRLLALCAEHRFDILLTIDKNLQYQQKVEKYELTILILDSLSSKVEELVLFLPALHYLIGTFEKGRAYVIDNTGYNPP